MKRREFKMEQAIAEHGSIRSGNYLASSPIIDVEDGTSLFYLTLLDTYLSHLKLFCAKTISCFNQTRLFTKLSYLIGNWRHALRNCAVHSSLIRPIRTLDIIAIARTLREGSGWTVAAEEREFVEVRTNPATNIWSTSPLSLFCQKLNKFLRYIAFQVCVPCFSSRLEFI